MVCLESSTRGAQSGLQAERAIGPGAHAFIKVCAWSGLRFSD